MLLVGTGRLAPAGRSPWALRIEEGRIAWIGDPSEAADANRVDLGAALVTPGLVDSHTHPVFAGDRADEAAARLEGARYDGGGILRTVAETRAASDETLELLVEGRLRAALAAGTTTVECKSGYGLTLDEELRHLRLLHRVAARVPVRVVPTFLGAHAVPPEAASAAEHAERVANDDDPGRRRGGPCRLRRRLLRRGLLLTRRHGADRRTRHAPPGWGSGFTPTSWR